QAERAGGKPYEADRMSEKARGKSRAFSVDYGDEGGSKPSSSLGHRRSSRDDQAVIEEDEEEEGSDAEELFARRGSRIEEEEDSGEVLVFSCRHVFHKRCLERKMKEQEAVVMAKRHGSIVSIDGSVDRGDRLMSPLTVAPEDSVIESRLFP